MSPIPSTQNAVFMQAHDLAYEKEQVAYPATGPLSNVACSDITPSPQQVAYMPAEACTGTFWLCPVQPVTQACSGVDNTWQMYPQPQCGQMGGQGAQCGNMWGTPTHCFEANAQQGSGFNPTEAGMSMHSQMPQYDNMWAPAQMFSVDQWGNMCGQAVVQVPFNEAHLMQPAALLDAPAQPDSPASLQGHIWRLSRGEQGCRTVQQAFDDAVSDDERIAFASELHSHVWEAVKCPNANHVVQKCIDTLRPVDSQFIIDEIQLGGVVGGVSAASRVARHRYGCRILQRLLEHCSSEQVHALMEDILSEAVQLATHIYANYVLSHLLEHGTDNQKVRLTKILAAHASTVGANSYGCAVLASALDHASPEAKQVLASALLVQPTLLTGMACSRHGHVAVKKALQVADAPQRKVALVALMEQKGWKSSRYGRALYSHLEKCWEQEQ